MREQTVEEYLVREVAKRGGMCVKLLTGDGAPDRIVVWPDGRTEFVELKRPVGGRMSALQEIYRRGLRRRGHKVTLVASKEAVLRLAEHFDETKTVVDPDSF